MSNGDVLLIFVAYDTHLYLIYYLSFSHFFWVYGGVGKDVKNVVLLARLYRLGNVGLGQLHD